MANGIYESFTNPSCGWSWETWREGMKCRGILPKIFYLVLGAFYLVLRVFMAIAKVVFVVCIGGLLRMFLTGGRRYY